MRQTRTLRRDQIQRLEAFRISRRLNIQQLKLAMDAPFTWPTLFRALRGKPILQAFHCYIVSWLDLYVPAKEVRDGKAAAANDPVPCSD
jgi:hypothetical protein